MNLQQNPKLSVSSNECHYTTLWNTICAKLFITTVMQALSVMTNWQLQTNTSQQMFKVFAFGFDTCIKTILPLINCLISDAMLDSRPCFNRFFTHFRWMSLCMMRPNDLRPPRNASFPGDLKEGCFICPWCTLLTEHQIIDCINVLSSTWCARSASARLSVCCASIHRF